mmetsp:Transcript_20054/g.43631  ORF Transcript_20054/g.43631 Transcript_20054/m.43631 type:complete len:354 (-) Transcript_20054:1396-2457(-)
MNFSISPALALQRKTITEESVKKETSRCSSHTSIGYDRLKNSMKNARKGPIESVGRDDLLDEKLRHISLSTDALTDLLSLLSSRLGETRAAVMGNAIFFRACIPAKFEQEISLLADFLWMPLNPTCTTPNIVENLCDLILDCLLLETCFFKLGILCGKDWYEEILALAKNPSGIDLVHNRLLDICHDAMPYLLMIRFEVMDLLMEHESREMVKLVWIERKMKHKMEQLEERTRKLHEVVNRVYRSNTENGLGQRRLSHDSNNLFDSLSRADSCNNDTARNGRFVSGFLETPANAVVGGRNHTQMAIAPSAAASYNLEMNTAQQHCLQHPSTRYSDFQEEIYYYSILRKYKKAK